MTRSDRFTLLCFIVVTAVWTAASLPVYSRAIAEFTGMDLLFAAGNGSGIGPGKIKVAIALASAGLAQAILLALLLPGRRDWHRLAIVVCVLAVLAPLPLWFERARDDDNWTSMQRTNIVVKPDVAARLFEKETLPREALMSFDDLYREAMRRRAVNSADLQRAWSAAGETLLAAFLLNLASGMYEFGNPLLPGSPGCIGYDRSRAAGPAGTGAMSESEILSSRIGCCDDFARLLKALLDRAGIQNRLVHLPGHVFNEAHLDGAWRAMDASINVLYDRSWRDVAAAGPKTTLQVEWYHLRGVSDPSAPFYQPVVLRFRIHMLLLAGKGDRQYWYSDPALSAR